MRQRGRSRPQRAITWCVQTVRPFCPGMRKMVILLLALQSVAVALMINCTVALSVVTVLAAGVVKIYKVNTEPVLLLILHTVLSCWMLLDSTTTLAVLVACVATAVTVGDCELSAERVTIFLLAIVVSYVFVKPVAILCGVGLAVVIALVKLRPLRPATASLIALAFLAWAILCGTVQGTVVTVLYMAGVIMLFVVDKIADSERFLCMMSPSLTYSNGGITSGTGALTINNNHKHHQPVPKGYLQLSSPTDSLDLHGHTVTGAMSVLHKFLRESEDVYRNNRAEHVRHVTVITGEGIHDDERSNGTLLKPTVLNFLKINKYKYEVSRDTPGLIRVDLESHVF